MLNSIAGKFLYMRTAGKYPYMSREILIYENIRKVSLYSSIMLIAWQESFHMYENSRKVPLSAAT